MYLTPAEVPKRVTLNSSDILNDIDVPATRYHDRGAEAAAAAGGAVAAAAQLKISSDW